MPNNSQTSRLNVNFEEDLLYDYRFWRVVGWVAQVKIDVGVLFLNDNYYETTIRIFDEIFSPLIK